MTALALLLALAVALRTAARSHAAASARATARSDVLGVYSLHPDSAEVARPFNCPQKITTNTFEFQVTSSPSTLPAPPAFNIIIPHINTLLDDRMCESSGNVIATTSDHPFVTMASNPLDVITYWAGAGTGQNATWVTEELVEAAAKQPFVLGYDFTERSCRGVRMRAGTAFLWFQPAWNIPLGKVQLTGKNKYLLLTFRNHFRAGCIFVADVVGGEGDFSEGPVSDPSVDAALENPGMLGDPPTVSVPPSSETQSDALQPTDEEQQDEQPDDSELQGDQPPEDGSDQSGSTFTEPDEEESDSEQSESSTGTIFGGAGSQGGTQTGLQPESESSAPACFSASSTVQLEDGSTIQLRDLNIGHRVQVRKGLYSDVFFFSHRVQHRNVMHNFVRIGTHDGHVLTLSEGHYLYVGGRMCAAGDVAIGDRLQVADGKHTVVVSLDSVKERGLYAPHTLHGDIVVDGVRVSTYTTAVHPRLAHSVLLAPVRLMYHAGVSGFLDGILNGGVRGLQRFLPRGPRRF